MMRKTWSIVFAFLMLFLCLPFAAACNDDDSSAPKTALAEIVDKTDIDKVQTEKTFTLSDSETDYGVLYPSFYVSNDMILQRRKVNVVTGKTYTASHVAVRLNGNVYYGDVENNDFRVYLPPMEASTGLQMEIFTDDAKLTVDNVAIGELFLCSGQSNMAWPVSSSTSYYTELIQTANYQNVRLLNMPKAEKGYAALTADATWKTATKGNVSTFSLFGLLYAISMQEKLGIPVGVVNASVGSTLLCYWLPRESVKTLEKTSGIYINYEKPVFSPSLGFNGMISPLRDLSFRGMVWYQGESNAYKENLYEEELKELIRAYRAFFEDETFTFTVVGLPRYNTSMQDRWGKMRIAQRAAVNASKYAVYTENTDIGDSADIHPRKKDIIAARAAAITLDEFFYAKESKQSFAVSAEKNGLNVIVTVQGGGVLQIKNGVNGFETSNDGVTWQPVASVAISDGKLVVTASEDFSYIRYAYKSNYEKDPLEASTSETAVSKFVSVFNEYGLPLGQFLFAFQ